MKRHIFATSICCCLLIVIFTPVSGCKNPSVQSKSVSTLFTLGSTVDAAYKGYLDLVLAGQVSTNSVPSVSQKYNMFQQSFMAAIEFVSFYSNAVPPASVLNAAAEFNTAVANAKQQ